MIKIKPLTINELIQLEHDKTQLPYDVTHLDLSSNVLRAVRIKIEKMMVLSEVLHNYYTYWLILEENTVIGMIGFKGIDEGVCEVGYGIHQSFEGKGYTTQALRQLILWSKENDIKKVTAHVLSKDNIGSIRILEKNGFTLDRKDEGVYYKLDL